MPVILLCGDNLVDLEDALHAVRARFNSADIMAFDGSSGSLLPVVEAGRTAGLFDPERLVVVDDLHERARGTKRDATLQEILALVADIAPTTTLLLVSREMAPDHPLLELVKGAGGAVRTFPAPARGEVSRWIGRRARIRGISIEPDAAELLADLAGGNTVRLDTELEKLATYAGPETVITTRMVDLLVGAVPRESIFALVDAIAAGHQSEALRLLHAQLAQASAQPVDVALYLIRMLARQTRILLRIRLGTRAGKSTSQLTRELALPRYYADRYFRQARRLEEGRLAASFEHLAAFEYALKSGRADPLTGLNLLVTQLCA